MELKKSWKWLILLIVVLGVLIYIPLSIDYEAATIKAAETAFHAEPLKTDDKVQDTSIFLPQGFILEEVSDNNLLVRKGQQEYLIFVNPEENRDSRLLYNNLTAIEDYSINQTFVEEDQFGYLLVNEHSRRNVDLIVGIGGYKITTTTDLPDMVDDAKNMMQIANSMQKQE